MKLEHIVPWGRSLEEYKCMFALSERDLRHRLLGCGDGPASFNAALAARGGQVISVDPLYRWSASAIEDRIKAVSGVVLDQVRSHRDHFCWNHIPSPEALYEIRMAAMDQFLADYESGRRNFRYIPAALPHLPFRADHFGRALCSHLLFTYSEHLDRAFHLRAIRAMLAVAPEVRIFPLVRLDGRESEHLDPIQRALLADGHSARRIPVDYEFQRGGNEMLCIVRGG